MYHVESSSVTAWEAYLCMLQGGLTRPQKRYSIQIPTQSVHSLPHTELCRTSCSWSSPTNGCTRGSRGQVSLVDHKSQLQNHKNIQSVSLAEQINQQAKLNTSEQEQHPGLKVGWSHLTKLAFRPIESRVTTAGVIVNCLYAFSTATAERWVARSWEEKKKYSKL